MADIPPAVRILPMDSKNEEAFVGKGAEEVQRDYFLRHLPSERRGRYQFRKASLKAEPGTVVLFQYDNRIIASATLDGIEQFEEPNGDYQGLFASTWLQSGCLTPSEQSACERFGPGSVDSTGPSGHSTRRAIRRSSRD